MSDTLANFTVTATPQKLSALTTIAKGTAARVENFGPYPVYYAIGSSLPDKTAFRKIEPTGFGKVVEIAAGQDEVWVWASFTSHCNAEEAA